MNALWLVPQSAVNPEITAGKDAAMEFLNVVGPYVLGAVKWSIAAMLLVAGVFGAAMMFALVRKFVIG